MLLQIEYLLLKVLEGAPRILERRRQCLTLRDCRLLLRKKRREIVETAAQWSLMRESCMNCLHFRLLLPLSELHQINVRLLYQVLLILLISDSSYGNAAELYIRPEAGIVIQGKVVRTVYSAEV